MLQEAPNIAESSSSGTVVCGVKVKQKACVELAASQNLQLSKQKEKEIVITLEIDSETKNLVHKIFSPSKLGILTLYHPSTR